MQVTLELVITKVHDVCVEDVSSACSHAVSTYVIEPGDALIMCPRFRIYGRRSATHFAPSCLSHDSNITKIRTASRVCTREQVLTPNAPSSDACDECREGEEGRLVMSALDCPPDQYTHNVYQVPGPESTYTLACCAIKGGGHVAMI